MKERRERERRFSMHSENPEQCIRRVECSRISKNVTGGEVSGPRDHKRGRSTDGTMQIDRDRLPGEI